MQLSDGSYAKEWLRKQNLRSYTFVYNYFGIYDFKHQALAVSLHWIPPGSPPLFLESVPDVKWIYLSPVWNFCLNIRQHAHQVLVIRLPLSSHFPLNLKVFHRFLEGNQVLSLINPLVQRPGWSEILSTGVPYQNIFLSELDCPLCI